MPADPQLDALVKELLDSGVAPKYILRITSELQDHCLDLEAEAQRAGVPAEEAGDDARQRLGDIAAIAREFSTHPELRSWVYTSSWLQPLLRGAAATGLFLSMPVRAIVASNAVVMRYTAAAAAGATMTVGLLLAMYTIVSSGMGPDGVSMLPRTLVGAAHERSYPQFEPGSSTSPRWPSADADTGGSGARSAHSRSRRPAADTNLEDDSGQRGDTGRAFGGAKPLVPMTATGRALPAQVQVAVLEPPLPSALPPLAAATELTITSPFGLRFGVSDRELRPIAKVETEYPWAAARRGLEGHVVVEYTVTRAGTISEIVVVESSNDVFNRAAIEAANGLKYTPRIIGGSPVEVRGVRTTIRFLLEA